jgi:hypothetical protein
MVPVSETVFTWGRGPLTGLSRKATGGKITSWRGARLLGMPGVVITTAGSTATAGGSCPPAGLPLLGCKICGGGGGGILGVRRERGGAGGQSAAATRDKRSGRNAAVAGSWRIVGSPL